MKKGLISLLCLLCWALGATAQQSSSSFTVLRLPASSHAAALGGENISLVEDAPSAAWANPALLANVSDNSAGLSFMTFTAGAMKLGAHYVKAFGERHTAAAQLEVMRYGAMDETDLAGNVLGSFAPRDMALSAGYGYLFSDRWTGGATLRMVTSRYADFSSVALAVDLGLNYYDDETDLSLSAALRHAGAQVKRFDNVQEPLPLSLELGMSKGMARAPVRFHLTLVDLNRWSRHIYYKEDDGRKMPLSRLLLNHVVFGIDILPSETLYFSAGYNFRRAYELKAAGKSRMAGLALGGGLRLKALNFGLSYARYHAAGASVMATAAYTF